MNQFKVKWMVPLIIDTKQFNSTSHLLLWTSTMNGPYFYFELPRKHLIIPPLPKGGGGYTVLPLSVCPSFRPSKIFFGAFFSVTVDGRNLIFGHKQITFMYWNISGKKLISLTYLERQKCYGTDKKILFKKQLFVLEVKGQGPTKVITVRDTPPYGPAVSPSNEGRHIVLVYFFFCFFSAKLVWTIAFLSFQIGQLYLVCGCMTIGRCVAYRNDLCGTLTFDLKDK
jgi:WD40 repeat protein